MVESNNVILVIEDEEAIRRFLRASLTSYGYQLHEANTGTTGLNLAAEHSPNLIILDLGLPDMDGCEVLTKVRAFSTVPTIVLSARGREVDKLAAFEVGADDYLTKPFGMRELLARITAVMRRSKHDEPSFSANERHVCRDLTIEFASRRITIGNRDVKLTPIEFKLLTLMAKHSGKVLTHRFLLQEVWGPDRIEEVNYLRVFMAALRRKIEVDSVQPKYLLTEQGIGYRLADE